MQFEGDKLLPKLKANFDHPKKCHVSLLVHAFVSIINKDEVKKCQIAWSNVATTC